MSLQIIHRYTCDRCEEQSANRTGWAMMVAERVNGPTLNMGKFNSDGPPTTLDLCPKCVSSLQKWKDKKPTT